MKIAKNVLRYIIAIILSVSIIALILIKIASSTVLNKNYILQKLESTSYYSKIYEEAKENFEKAKKEGNEEAAYYLAKVYEAEGDPNYAMILLEEYLAGGKAGAEGYLTVAHTYFAEGRYEEALGILQEGIALGESGALKNLMQEEIACYERLGNFEAARETAAAYLEKYPEDAAIQKEYEFLKSR